MDELNRPLGQKPESKGNQRTVTTGQWLGAAGLITGLAAIVLVGWQILRTQQTVQIATQTTEQVQAGEPSEPGDVATGSSDDDALRTEDQQTAGSEGVDEPSDNNGSGLVELKPEGTLAVPKPRPPRAARQEADNAHLPDPDLLERSEAGVIPRRSSDGRRPMDVYAREPDTSGNFGVARIVLIVGGMGLSQTATQQAIKSLPPAAVLAFAPYGNSMSRWMQEARKKGHELLLQLPMEPFGYPQNTPGPRTLVSSASTQENLANLHWAMSQLTNYVGVMNYQGAKLLSSPDALKPLFDDIAERGLLFVDDGSSNGSRSREAANRSVLPYATAHVQIDIKRDRRSIANQIDVLVKEAKRTGIAIGVANGFPDTIRMLAEFSSQANGLGVEITPVSAIVSDPEREG